MAINGWCNNKSTAWGKSTEPNPTDRSKSGTKRILLVEGQGISFGINVNGISWM